jgi:AhpD family alkylhydroperoxidase
MDLLFLRVSQINGCSYCVDEHARDLRRAGGSNERLDGLAAWRESPYFTQAEKVALEWTEALTASNRLMRRMQRMNRWRAITTASKVANITYAIALMNAWNRVAIGFHEGPSPIPRSAVPRERCASLLRKCSRRSPRCLQKAGPTRTIQACPKDS